MSKCAVAMGDMVASLMGVPASNFHTTFCWLVSHKLIRPLRQEEMNRPVSTGYHCTEETILLWARGKEASGFNTGGGAVVVVVAVVVAGKVGNAVGRVCKSKISMWPRPVATRMYLWSILSTSMPVTCSLRCILK